MFLKDDEGLKAFFEAIDSYIGKMLPFTSLDSIHFRCMQVVLLALSRTLVKIVSLLKTVVSSKYAVKRIMNRIFP